MASSIVAATRRFASQSGMDLRSMVIRSITSYLERSAQERYRDILMSTLSRYQEANDKGEAIRVLDVGAGNCWLLNLLPRRCTKIGVDLHAHQHSVGHSFEDFQSSESCHFIFGDAIRLPFRDETFDIVYSNEFLSHVRSVDEALVEELRVCRKGGTVLAMDANVLNPVTFANCFIINYVQSRGAETKRGGLKWLLRRDQPFCESAPLERGSRRVCWTDENIHSHWWWRRKVRQYSAEVDFEVSTFWSYLPMSWFELFANKVLIVATKL